MRAQLLFILLCGCVLSTPTARAGIVTGPVTNPSNGNTYYLLTQNNWTGSEAEAITFGGHLATVNDAAENAWIASTFSDFGGVSRALWIGLNDAAAEGTFVWASGEPVVYTNWAGGEPTNTLGGEDWAHIFPSIDGRHPSWNDAPDLANAFGFVFNGVVEISAIPESSSALLLGTVLAGMGLGSFQRRATWLAGARALV